MCCRGDESRQAASLLEGVVLDDYLGDERLEELVYMLSMYAPGGGCTLLRPEGTARGR